MNMTERLTHRHMHTDVTDRGQASVILEGRTVALGGPRTNWA